jgi:hypothetical protein
VGLFLGAVYPNGLGISPPSYSNSDGLVVTISDARACPINGCTVILDINNIEKKLYK